ncbi:MAG: hypothetical protein WBS22_04960, partial [Methylocystis sp.]
MSLAKKTAVRYGLKSSMRTSSIALLAALAPAAAYAANPDSWNGNTSNAWGTATNWSGSFVPGTGANTNAAVTIGNSNLQNNPVQINANYSLNTGSGTTTGSLTVGAGAAPGQANGLNINSTYTLTMGTHAITLDGGSITGLGTLSSSGSISGYGTISSLLSGTPSFTANATNGTTYTFSPSYKDGTPGTPITLIGQQNLTSNSFTISNHGSFNFQGIKLTTPKLSGTASNLNAGPMGGNNNYGLFTFTGADSTVVGNVANGGYQQFRVGDGVNPTTLHLSNFSLTNNWATNVPPFFVINAGGTVDNTTGNSNLTGSMAVVLNGGSLTNSGGGTFTAPGLITGYGLVSGPISINGGLTAGPGTTSATSGTLTVDGTSTKGPITIGATGWGSSAGFTLDMKGTFNYPTSGGFLNPGTGTVQFDSATLNNTGHTIYTGAGKFVVNSGVNTFNTAMIPNGTNSTVPDYTIKNGATLNVNNTNTSNNAIYAQNFTMENNSKLSVNGSNTVIQVAGNFLYSQTDKVNAWTYHGTAGLGPDLIMTGGAKGATPVQLEAGSVNMGNKAAGYVDN